MTIKSPIAIMKRCSLLMLLLMMPLVLVTCGGKGPLPPADTIPPKVISISPANGMLNIPVNLNVIMITFSEAMDTSTINDQTITLSHGPNSDQGLVTVTDPTGVTVVFAPPANAQSFNLNPTTLYTITISGVKDTSGNFMVAPFVTTFSTGTVPDTTPPSVIANTPAAGAKGVGLNISPSVTFSEPVIPQTIVFILSAGATTIPCMETYSGTTAIFTPSNTLAPVTTYNALVGAATKDLAGNAMTSDYSWSFTTALGSTTMSLSAPGVTYGANGIVTITVNSGGGIPTGDVSLRVDSGAAVVQTLTGGSTTFTIPSLIARSHALSAAYSAQGSFGASSASGTLIVNQAATTTNIAAPGVSSGADGSVTVTVSSTAGTPTGAVSLSVDGGAAMTQTLSNGSTTFTILSPSIGSHALNATYTAQGNFQASSALGTLGVGPGATTMTLSAPGVTYNANGSVTVTIISTAGTPTGAVSLSVDGGAAMVQTLTGGSTIFTIPGLSAVSHALSATYAAQGSFGTSSASGTLIVNQALTTTNIAAPGVPYGTDGSVTVTVSSTGGTPTGNVSLSVDGGSATTQPLDNSGSATFMIPRPFFGTHALFATYGAQGNFGASSSSGTLGVGPGATTMTLSAPGVTYNANGSVTVTVSSAAGTPTGNVSLSVDGGTATTQPLSGGSATFIIPSPSAVTHPLNAEYLAQGIFQTSTASGNLIVSQAPTTTIIIAPTITFGADGSVIVMVSSTAGTPIGNVSLSVDGGAAMTLPLSNGSTSFTIPSPSAGSHALSATYAAQGNFGASQASGTLGVGPGATAMSLSAPVITYGMDGSVTITVSSTAGTPTGNVSLSVNGGSATTQPLSGGSATFTISSPAVATYTLNAEYVAQGNFGLSAASGNLTVSQASTSAGVTSSLNPSTFGDSVTFTATVTPSTATGTVTFSDGGISIGTGTLSGGTATFSTSALTGGVHSITAEYGGDTNFAVSTSSALSQTVN